MKSLMGGMVLSMMLASMPNTANADGPLAQKKNCMGCHHMTDRRVGPAFKQIAAKYVGQADTVDKLTLKVLKGGAGAWGAVPMPANSQVTPSEARQLVLWILAQK